MKNVINFTEFEGSLNEKKMEKIKKCVCKDGVCTCEDGKCKCKDCECVITKKECETNNGLCKDCYHKK